MEDRVLRALGEPKRYLLLQLMSDRGGCVRALAKKSGISESAVSQHLKVLREAGLVVGVKRGYYVHYQLDREAIGRIVEALVRLRDAERRPCSGPFYGCEVAETLACKSFVPIEKREKEN